MLELAGGLGHVEQFSFREARSVLGWWRGMPQWVRSEAGLYWRCMTFRGRWCGAAG